MIAVVNDERPDSYNVLTVLKAIGEAVTIKLPDGGLVEVTVDGVFGDRVSLAFAVTQPLRFVDVEEK